MADQEVKVRSPKKSRMRDLTTNEAILEVEKLKDRVRTFSLSSSVSGESSDASGRSLVRKQDDLLTCLAVMRRLLDASEAESHRLKDEKAVIATRISSSLNAVNREVKTLKAELRDQDKRLVELANSRIQPIEEEEEEVGKGNMKDENNRLRRENEFLVKELHDWKEGNTNLDELRQRLHSKDQEINRAKEAIVCMKGERQRSKTEKIDLLDQMKQVYGILETKESELREFIQNYGECMRKSQEQLEKLSNERDVWDRDVKNARSEIETLQSKLESKTNQVDVLESELSQVRERLIVPEQSPLIVTNDIAVNMRGIMPASNSDDDVKNLSGEEMPSYLYNADASDVFESDEPESPIGTETKSKKRSSFSRLFSRGKSRKFTFSHSAQEYSSNTQEHFNPNSTVSQKRALWEVHKEIPVECWKANMVLAWLEVECQMSMYARPVFDNIKSGKVLLELSDTDLGVGLAINKTMHRRKLRLAIEDYRDPRTVEFPKMSSVDHIWLSRTWTQNLGLSQYSAAFEMQLIDGRLLNVLSRKDMEKYLNIQKKFHQMSLLCGIELFRMVGFDRKVLTERQSRCDEADVDPLVWTNERLIKWCHSIDLGEYAESLRDSGVHGAVIVLEQSFGPDDLAQALNIHHSKNIIRRHLTSEFQALVIPARAALTCDEAGLTKREPRKAKRRRPLSFSAPRRTNIAPDVPASRYNSFKGWVRSRDKSDSCPSLKVAPSPILTNGSTSMRSRRPKSSLH